MTVVATVATALRGMTAARGGRPLTLQTVLDLIAGALLAFAAVVGLLRFGDVVARTPAATAPQVSGLLLILTGAGIRLHTSVDVRMIALVTVLQLIPAPGSARVVGGLAYRTRHVRREALVHDDLASAAAQKRGGPHG